MFKCHSVIFLAEKLHTIFAQFNLSLFAVLHKIINDKVSMMLVIQ